MFLGGGSLSKLRSRLLHGTLSKATPAKRASAKRSRDVRGSGCAQRSSALGWAAPARVSANGRGVRCPLDRRRPPWCHWLHVITSYGRFAQLARAGLPSSPGLVAPPLAALARALARDAAWPAFSSFLPTHLPPPALVWTFSFGFLVLSFELRLSFTSYDRASGHGCASAPPGCVRPGYGIVGSSDAETTLGVGGSGLRP